MSGGIRNSWVDDGRAIIVCAEFSNMDTPPTVNGNKKARISSFGLDSAKNMPLPNQPTKQYGTFSVKGFKQSGVSAKSSGEVRRGTAESVSLLYRRHTYCI